MLNRLLYVTNKTRVITMPVQKQVTLYTIDELPTILQEKACEDYRLAFDFEFFAEDIMEWFEETNPHIENMCIRYSGFWSQGDGASFTCSHINTEWLVKEFLADKPYAKYIEHVDVRIDRHGNFYVHESTCHVAVSEIVFTDDCPDEILECDSGVREDIQYSLIDGLETWRKNLCHEIYDNLHKEYNSLTTDETITQSLRDNDVLFRQNGDFWI